MKTPMDCPECGFEMYRIRGLYFDRDGMRDACFCNNCLTVFGTHPGGYSKQYKLKDYYSDPTDKIKNLLQEALREIEDKSE